MSDDAKPATLMSPGRPGPLLRTGGRQGAHGMASGEIANTRLLSRAEHEHHTQPEAPVRRAASEPRRRPSDGHAGAEAKALIFGGQGHAFDEGGSSGAAVRYDRRGSMGGSPMMMRGGADGAGRSSRELNSHHESFVDRGGFRRGQRDSFSGSSLGALMGGDHEVRRMSVIASQRSAAGGSGALSNDVGFVGSPMRPRVASPRPTTTHDLSFGRTSPHRNASTLVLG